MSSSTSLAGPVLFGWPHCTPKAAKPVQGIIYRWLMEKAFAVATPIS